MNWFFWLSRFWFIWFGWFIFFFVDSNLGDSDLIYSYDIHSGYAESKSLIPINLIQLEWIDSNSFLVTQILSILIPVDSESTDLESVVLNSVDSGFADCNSFGTDSFDTDSLDSDSVHSD